MNISIIGAGCVGSVLATKIHQIFPEEVGTKVRFIATGARAERLSKEGIVVNDERYMIPVQSNDEPKAELVIVCVKNYDLDQACLDMAPFIDESTIILPMLNSVSPTPTLIEKFPNNKVLYGYITKIDAMKNSRGFVYNVAGDIHFGYANNKSVQPELIEISNILNRAGFKAFIDEDMVRGVWKKWMLNVGANQVSALTEANYVQFSKISEIENILCLAMQELLTIACYEKVNLSTVDILDTIEYLTTYPFPKQTSMLQDILAHRKTEIDYISGDIIKFSHKWNCPCPVNLTMYYLIKSKEKTYLM